VAVFARSGSTGPLFLVLEFEAALPTRLFVDSTPVVFPLVELLDNFHRYVLLICNEESARVLEVSLGSVTREVWTHRPELRKRVGREWTKLHYQNHRRDRTDRFVKEKIGLVERVMTSGGHTHLMLAGNPQVLARVRKGLPKSLESKLVDAIPASSRDRSTDVVLATLSSFLEHEEQESLAAVGALRRELRTGGLAVAGHRACREALLNGQADLLVMLADRDDQDTAPREELTRLALEHDVHVEVVQHSEELEELGGVGCLLRYEIFDHPTDAADQAA
jgi:protein required for attachment to host cells/ribosomal protein L7Ae-like RNA K-turn-binding protein